MPLIRRPTQSGARRSMVVLAREERSSITDIQLLDKHAKKGKKDRV